MGNHTGELFALAASGDAGVGDEVEKFAGVAGDHGDPLRSVRGSDEIDEAESRLLDHRLVGLCLFERKVGNDEAVDSGCFRLRDEPLHSLMVEGVEIAHPEGIDHRSDLPGNVEELLQAKAPLQRPEVGTLDDGAVGDGIGKGNAQLQGIDPRFGQGQGEIDGKSGIGISGGYVGDKSFHA